MITFFQAEQERLEKARLAAIEAAKKKASSRAVKSSPAASSSKSTPVIERADIIYMMLWCFTLCLIFYNLRYECQHILFFTMSKFLHLT